MTCIAAIKCEGGIVMGSDDRSSKGDLICPGAQKIWRHTPDDGIPWIMGYAGLDAAMKILRYNANPLEKKPCEDLERYLHGTWLPQIQETFIKKKDFFPDLDKLDLNILLGIEGELFEGTIKSLFHVSRSYEAIGSGRGEACGVLHYTQSFNMDPDERIRGALAAAAEHHESVGSEFNILEI
jgi:20S proteasome alpha/beta subunit